MINNRDYRQRHDNMKQKLTILFTVITLTTFGQKNQTVDLKWKIGENEKLNYYTVMSEIDESSFEMDFGVFFEAFSDSTFNKTTKDLFKKINDSFEDQDFVTTLTNKNNGVIDIVMTTKPKEADNEEKNDSNDDDFLKKMQLISQGVMLRGSVYETGGIHSFWVKSSQKNLIALFFELPTKPVKVGDKWSLDVNLIANDQSFDCDSSSKINEVTLTEIKEVNGETIAVLEYNIVEYVKGSYAVPSLFGSSGEVEEATMKYSHQGIAEFSVDNGRWINYDGIMSFESTGVMTANKKTKFALIDEKNADR